MGALAKLATPEWFRAEAARFCTSKDGDRLSNHPIDLAGKLEAARIELAGTHLGQDVAAGGRVPPSPRSWTGAGSSRHGQFSTRGRHRTTIADGTSTARATSFGKFGAGTNLAVERRMRWVLPITVCVGACTPRAVTPPSRTFVMDSPSAPAAGHSDVQLDAAGIGETWGPNLVGGNARLRRTVEPGVSVEADAGVLHVTNPGQGGDRNGYTGRLGVLLHSQDRHWALGAGLGGGLSQTAGNWGSVDVHGVISGAHHYIRPMLGGGIGYSTPFGDRTFVVSQSGEDQPGTTLQLPRNVIGQLHVGLELGPPDQALVLGVSGLRFWLREDSRVSMTTASAHLDETFAAVGIGLRIAID
jgi:hypothetical protein